MNYPLPSIFKPKSTPAPSTYVCVPEYGTSQVMVMAVVKSSFFSDLLLFDDNVTNQESQLNFLGPWSQSPTKTRGTSSFKRFLKIALIGAVGFFIFIAILHIFNRRKR